MPALSTALSPSDSSPFPSFSWVFRKEPQLQLRPFLLSLSASQSTLRSCRPSSTSQKKHWRDTVSLYPLKLYPSIFNVETQHWITLSPLIIQILVSRASFQPRHKNMQLFLDGNLKNDCAFIGQWELDKEFGIVVCVLWCHNLKSHLSHSTCFVQVE